MSKKDNVSGFMAQKMFRINSKKKDLYRHVNELTLALDGGTMFGMQSYDLRIVELVEAISTLESEYRDLEQIVNYLLNEESPSE